MPGMRRTYAVARSMPGTETLLRPAIGPWMNHTRRDASAVEGNSFPQPPPCWKRACAP